MINNVNTSITEHFLNRLDQLHHGKPWHGKNWLDILGMGKEPFKPEIIRIVYHMIAWRKYTIAFLKGEKYDIDLNSTDDWPLVDADDYQVVEAFKTSQEELIKAFAEFDERKWMKKAKGAKYTYAQLSEGLIDHDIYHSGQIALLLKE